MSVYRYVADSDHYECIAVRKQDRPIMAQFHHCRSLADSWWPVPVEVDASVGGPGDFPSLRGIAPVFSQRAWEVLRPLIGDVVEALPISYPSGSYFAVNALDVVDCLDRERSELAWYDDGGIMAVDVYVFQPARMKGKHFFRIPETSLGEILLSEKFREVVEHNGL